MSRFNEGHRLVIQEHQAHALGHPFQLGKRPDGLRVMVFPLSTRQIYGILTVDLDWVDGTAWHLYLSDRMIDGVQVIGDVGRWDHQADLEVAAIIRGLLGSVGVGPIECYATGPEWSIHAFRLVTESERAQITPADRGAR
jgi:hypothetical protein